MSKYEAILILDDHVYEDGGDAFIDQIESTIQDLSGTITERKSLGRRQFARQMGKRSTGIYWDLIVELPPGKVADLKEKYRLDTSVLRLAVYTFDRPARLSLKPDRSDDEKIVAGTAADPATANI